MVKLINDGLAVIHNRKYPTDQISSRFIVMTKRRVYKFDNGGDQCASEADNYKRITPRDKKYFPKVFNSGDGWICMERIKFSNKGFTAKQVAIVDRLSRKYGLSDVDSCEGDTGLNCCINDKGQPIIFDFAL